MIRAKEVIGFEIEGPIYPRPDRKEVAGIGSNQLLIGEVIAQRRSRAATRDGYIALGARVALIALAVFLIFQFCFLFAQVHGQSMIPALKDGDLCVVFRTGLQQLLAGGFQKNDVVAFKEEGKRFIGRVVAVAGDEVEINASGTLAVNGVTQTRSALLHTDAQGNQASCFTVPPNSLFILGDSRTEEKDSWGLGPISLECVEGKVISILRRRGL